MQIDPKDDGVTHINVYSKGKTQLGRKLSNFAFFPLKTVDGNFKSIEGYWYWLLCEHKDKDLLRDCWGYDAKRLGRELKAKDWPDKDISVFKAKIETAIHDKIYDNPGLFNELRKSTLPFVHYYCFGNIDAGGVKVIPCPEAQWVIDYISGLRDHIRALNPPGGDLSEI